VLQEILHITASILRRAQNKMQPEMTQFIKKTITNTSKDTALNFL